MRTFGYPRSGNHFLMRSLWLTFGGDNYRSLFGQHFATEFPADSLGIIRQPMDVMRSLWKMREWFGLSADSFEQFLSQPYRESFRPHDPVTIWCNFEGVPEQASGKDNCLDMLDEPPLAHHDRCCQAILDGCSMVVSYEELRACPVETLSRIGERFGLDGTPRIPDRPWGYNVQPAAEDVGYVPGAERSAPESLAKVG